MSARTIQALLLLTLAIVGLWTPVRADIQDGLDDMFMVTGQEPAVYESQRRGGVTMGTFRVRSPINSINLVNLTAPEIRAGLFREVFRQRDLHLAGESLAVQVQRARAGGIHVRRM